LAAFELARRNPVNSARIRAAWNSNRSLWMPKRTKLHYVPRWEQLEVRNLLSPVPFVIRNQSGLPDASIHLALYGKDAGFVAADNPNGFIYIDATGTAHSLSGSDPGGGTTTIPFIAQTTLAGPINDTQTTITVTSSSGFPTAYPPGNPWTPIIIDSEVLLVSGIVPNTQGLTWNVVRGSLGTTKAAHSGGAPVKWDVQYVPNFNLTSLPKQGNDYILNLTSTTTIHSGRLLMGVHTDVIATITTDKTGGIAGGNVTGVAPPAAGNSADNNTNTYYDFFELDFAGGNINGNTTQIDQFGIPYTLHFQPGDPNNPAGVGFIATRADIIAGFKEFVAGTPFEDCWKLSPSGSEGILRLLSPGSILELQPDNPLHTYFNSFMDGFYFHNSQAGNFVDLTVTSIPGIPTRIYRGSVVKIGNNWVFRFKQHGTDPGGGSDPNNYDVYYPFFTDNAASYAGYTPLLSTAAAPTWLAGTTTSPSEMVFAAHEVFADNVSQFPSDATASKILGNLENQLVAALNRGVAMNPSNTWGDNTTFYKNATYNWYAHFFHNTAYSIDAKAYGFPYDDQAEQSSDFAVNGLTQLTLTLGLWGSTTKVQLFAVGGANGIVQLYQSVNNTFYAQFAPYGDGYSGGVTLAWGDVNGDTFDDLITSAAVGNPHVNVYDGRAIENGDFDPTNPSASLLASWFAFAEGFNVGANVAAGDVDNDGYADIAAAANVGNPDVRLYKGYDIAHGTFNPNGSSIQAQWFAYGLGFNIGANVAIGDLNHDGWADVTTGASAGNPEVKVYNGEAFANGTFQANNPNASVILQFFAYALQFDIGAFVAAGDTNGDGLFELITGASSGNPVVNVYNGGTGALLSAFFAYAANQNIGAAVGVGEVNGSPAIFTAPTRVSTIYKAFSAANLTEIFQGVPAEFPPNGVTIAA
jgi:hypothetical protein